MAALAAGAFKQPGCSAQHTAATSLVPVLSVLSKYSTELILNDFNAANTDDFHTYLMVFLKKLCSWSNAIKKRHALLLRKRLSDHLFAQETRKVNLYITKLGKS